VTTGAARRGETAARLFLKEVLHDNLPVIVARAVPAGVGELAKDDTYF